MTNVSRETLGQHGLCKWLLLFCLKILVPTQCKNVSRETIFLLLYIVIFRKKW